MRTLAEKFPELIKEWHPTENGNMTPFNIACYSNKPAVWVCEKGHPNYTMDIYNRTLHKQKCPYCSGKRACKENSLATLFPEIAKEWNYAKNKMTPNDYTAFSNEEVEWICPKGHEYSMTIANRTAHHQNCSCCAGKQVCDDNRLSILFSEIAKQWHPTKNGDITPHDIVVGSNTKRWWICDKCQYEWEASPNKRTGNNGRGCPKCAGQVLTKDNCLGTKYPELIESWDYEKNYPLTPFDVFPSTTKPLYWKCKRGHDSYYMRSDHRINGHGCPRCFGGSSRLQRFIYWELEVFYKDILYRYKINKIECDIFLPSENIAIEMDGYRWHKDNCKHDDVKATKLKELGITLINVRENGLDRVSDNTIYYEKFEDLFPITKRVFTLLSKITNKNELANYTNNEFSLNRAKYYNEIAGLKDIPKEKQLLFVNPQLASQWDYSKNILTPADVTVHSHDKPYWICDKGHPSFRSAVCNRNHGQGCPECWKIRHKNLHKTKNS